MSALLKSFWQMLRCVKQDGMLFLSCLAPFLCGCFFKFAIPSIERMLTGYYGLPHILSSYYALFDLLLATMTPLMFSFVSAMVILEETDEHTAGYLFITPLRKSGYLLSRLGIPLGFSLAITIGALEFFKLSDISHHIMFLISVAGVLQGLISALIIISFSTNKLEGLAITKISSLMILGLFGPFFLTGRTVFLLFPLPSLWMARILLNGGFGNIFFATLTSLLWVTLLGKSFFCKVSV
ncbi:MAG: hypothetical protein WCR02_01000 [Sphaerochaetaceae bacterium]